MILKLTNNGKSVYGTREDGAMVSYSIEAEEYKQWLSEGNTPEPEFTEAELAQQLEDAKPKVVTMRQARLALLQAGLLTTVDTAIANGIDGAMKIEWEYATEVRRDWESLITMATALGMTSSQLDDLFLLASTL